MLKKDRNLFIELISKANMETKLFSAFEENARSFVIQLIDTKLLFKIQNSDNSFEQFVFYLTEFVPKPKLLGPYPTNKWTGINEIRKEFSSWLDNHVRPYLEDHKLPDLWALNQQEHEIFGTPEFDLTGMEIFSQREKDALHIAIIAFRNRIKELFIPDNKQLKYIEQRLDYLNSSIERLNKFDWKSLLFSTIISIATTLSLDTERGRLLFEIAKQIFSTALHLLK